MGPSLYRLCKFEQSLQFFSESLSKDPNNVEVLTNKGSALAKLGYFNEAIMHYDKAIEINSNFLPALNNKANMLANMGQHEEAISLYAEVLGKNPGYLTARQNLEIALSDIPQKNNPIPPKQVPPITEDIVTYVPTTNLESMKLQKEKSPDILEQVSSMLSSIVSILGITN
jgi:tetratricopeptide (TPR) repeat protein